MNCFVTFLNYIKKKDCNFLANEQCSELWNIVHSFPKISLKFCYPNTKFFHINAKFYYWSNYSKIEHFSCMGKVLQRTRL
jgi:hypothetical protein